MLTDELAAEIREIAETRAPKNGLTPEPVISAATHYAERAEVTAVQAVGWAIDSLSVKKENRGFG